MLDQRLKLWRQGLIAQGVIHRPKSIAEMILIRAAEAGLRLVADGPERNARNGPWCLGD